jgi:branched-chain amino acid transport system ATP-binding protein
MSPLLEIEHLSLSFAGVRALDDVSFTVDSGELFAVIGPNGAGKSSLFNCISGVYLPAGGSIRFAGQELTGLKPHQIAQRGIARTFQNVEVFPTLTVLENLLLARHNAIGAGVFAGMLRLSRRKEQAAVAMVTELAELLHIDHLLGASIGSLPHGTQKRVELARALAAEPKLIMLDEPVAGMNHDEKTEMTELITQVNRDFGVAVLLVEHDMTMVMGNSARVCVLDFGVRIALGTPAEVVRDELVVAAYLGGGQ